MQTLEIYPSCRQELEDRDCHGLASHAQELVKNGYCTNVRVTELLPGDGQIFAWYDNPCVDFVQKTYKCMKAGSGRLIVTALRQHTASTVAIKATLKVDAFPSEVIQVESGSPHNGYHSSPTNHFVLLPVYPLAPPSCTSYIFSIIRLANQNNTDATIDIVVTAKREKVQSTQRTINLPLAAPSQGAQKGAHMDLATVVVAESVKILVREGWTFLRTWIGSDNDAIIKLNLGDRGLMSNDFDDGRVTKAISESEPRLTPQQVNELAGYNARYNQFSLKKKNLLKARSYHPVQSAEAETEIELIDADMKSVQKDIWNLLHASGTISVSKS